MHIVNKFIPPELSLEVLTDGYDFYKIDTSCFEKLFESSDYRKSLHIASSIEEAIVETNNDANDTIELIIIVGKDPPAMNQEKINNGKYKLRVICLPMSEEIKNDPTMYDDIHYMGHGECFSSWWKQE